MKFRLNKVVHKDTQNEFLFLNIAAVLLLGIAVLFGITIFLLKNYSGLIGPFTPQETIVSVLATGALILGVLLATLRLNHGLSGPLLVLRNSLERLGRGDLSVRMNLRKGDRLQDLGGSFNESIGELDAKIIKIKELGKILANGSDQDQQLRPLVRELNRKLGELVTSSDDSH